jgi:hypothetical protein
MDIPQDFQRRGKRMALEFVLSSTGVKRSYTGIQAKNYSEKEALNTASPVSAVASSSKKRRPQALTFIPVPTVNEGVPHPQSTSATTERTPVDGLQQVEAEGGGQMTGPQTATIFLLPIEIVHAIFALLDLRGLASVSCVCKHGAQVAHDPILWFHASRDLFPKGMRPPEGQRIHYLSAIKCKLWAVKKDQSLNSFYIWNYNDSLWNEWSIFDKVEFFESLSACDRYSLWNSLSPDQQEELLDADLQDWDLLRDMLLNPAFHSNSLIRQAASNIQFLETIPFRNLPADTQRKIVAAMDLETKVDAAFLISDLLQPQEMIAFVKQGYFEVVEYLDLEMRLDMMNDPTLEGMAIVDLWEQESEAEQEELWPKLSQRTIDELKWHLPPWKLPQQQTTDSL